MKNLETGTDLIVFSSNPFGSEELRTSSLMSMFAETKRVYFFEAPIIGVSKTATYFLKKNEHEVTIIQPYLPAETSVFEQKEALFHLLKELIQDENISHYTIWTDTPTAMPYVRKLSAEIIIYDCVKDFSVTHPELEQELFQYADVVLTSALTKDIPRGEVMTTAPTTSNVLKLIAGYKNENSGNDNMSQKA